MDKHTHIHSRGAARGKNVSRTLREPVKEVLHCPLDFADVHRAQTRVVSSVELDFAQLLLVEHGWGAAKSMRSARENAVEKACMMCACVRE